MKRKFGINCDFAHDADPVWKLENIKSAGFDAFFTGPKEPEVIRNLRNRADEFGLDFEFIHAPFKNINSMWLEGDDYKGIFDGMCNSIDQASETGVPTVIVHTSSGWKGPAICDLGLSRFDALVDYADKKSVTVAFENLRMIGNTAYMVERYEDRDNVRFCYDVGHEHCYTKTVVWPDIFCHKIIATHIHDNLGRGWGYEKGTDLHLLPFDGTVDYRRMISKLNEYEYKGSLMLEVFSDRHERYQGLSVDEFLNTCFERLTRIEKLGEI